MKQHNAAIEDFNSAIKLEPAHPENYYYRGLSKIQKMKLDDAIKDFEYTQQLGCTNPVSTQE